MKQNTNTKRKFSRYLIVVIVFVLPVIFATYNRYKSPRLSSLKTTYLKEIKPLINELEEVSAYEEERVWLSCGVEGAWGDENCPSYRVTNKINRHLLVTKFNEVTTNLESSGWRVVKFPDSEKLCILLRDNIDQFSQGIFGTVCERDFYKGKQKLKIYSSWYNQEGPDTLTFSVRIIDAAHDRGGR